MMSKPLACLCAQVSRSPAPGEPAASPAKHAKVEKPHGEFRILKRITGWLAVFPLAGMTACSWLGDSPARDPYRYAPSTSAQPWHPVDGASFLGSGEKDRGSASNSSRLTLEHLSGTDDTSNLEKTNDLADLIALAQRANPQTRVAWEQARAAAARLGVADSAFAPMFALLATGGYERNDFPTTDGQLIAKGAHFDPSLSLEWTLLDFGRRRAAFDSAAQQLLQANFKFNRTHQQLAYDTQRAFYAFDSARARIDAAETNLMTAQSVEKLTEVQMENGLATQTERLQALQELARAQFDLQSAQRSVSDAWAFLAETVGQSPTTPFNVVDLSSLPVPTNLVESVEAAIDRALRQRPDLAAQLAQVRAREAEVRRARAEFRPSIGLTGSVGGTMGRWDVSQPGHNPASYDYVDPEYGAFLTFSWNLFDGFERKNRLREATAQRNEAEAALKRLELSALREVWKAYADTKVSFLQYNFAIALFMASSDSYDATLRAYQNGLGTIIDLLTAERDLARARTTVVDSRAEVLTSSAALAFAVGDWTRGTATNSAHYKDR
jgi:outer membrane protein TolC